EGGLHAASGGVDTDVSVLRLLVGRGDPGELRDLTATRLGVQALAVAALALLDRSRDMHQEERAASGLDHRAHLVAGLGKRRDRAHHREPTVSRDLGGHPPDATDVGLAILLAEGEARGEGAAYDVSVEAGDAALARLQDP